MRWFELPSPPLFCVSGSLPLPPFLFTCVLLKPLLQDALSLNRSPSFSYTNSGSCCFSQWPTLTGPADGSPLRLWSGHAGILPTTDPSSLFLTVLPPLQHVNESQGHRSFMPRTWLSAPPPTAWESLSTYSLQKSLLFLWFLVLLMFISGFLKLAIWHNFPWKVGKLFKKFFLSCVYGWICVYGWMFMSDSVGRVNVWPLHACFWLLLDAWVSKFCVSVIAIVANDWTQILCLTFPVLNLMKVILCCSALSKQLTILGMV